MWGLGERLPEQWPQVSTPATPVVGWSLTFLLCFTAVKIIAAAFMLAARSDSPALAAGSVPVAFVVLQLVSFGGTSAVLLIANARDRRTTFLGAVLLLVASAFATGHFLDLARLTVFARWAVPVYPDAFLGYFLAKFVAEFPPRAPQSASARAVAVLTRAALVIGWVLFTVNAFVGWQFAFDDHKWAIGLLRRSAGGTLYWTLTFLIVLLLLSLTVTGTRTLPLEERRRIRLFWSAFAVGFGPVVTIVVLGALPGVGPSITRWAVSIGPMSVIQLFLATVPITVSYAVLVRRLLPLRVVLRQAVQYLLARSVVTAAFLIPLGIVITLCYTNRQQTIADAFSGHLRAWAAILVVAGIGLLGREELLRYIDRRFFREDFDAREVLLNLTADSRRVHRIEELVALVTAGLDRALRPESLAILVRDRSRSQFLSPFGSVEPVPCSAVLAEVLSTASEPVEVSLEPAHAFSLLPRAERQWLVDSRARLLLALRASDSGLLGFVTLGERRSELPYSREDRRLLAAIAESAALTIEHHAVRHEASEEDDWWRVGAVPHSSASECELCGLVQMPTDLCIECGSQVSVADVPRLMFGKFQFNRRIGRGAMGIVYEVRDLSLDRTVAIKTLPGTSPEHSERLRREAKAMAAVTHVNLATIHGAESWRGRPMLVCEFMVHGTLAARLAQSALSVEEALRLGVALADALAVIHGAGLLHGDIKPSNIGFAHDRTPKLLDFGLVRMLAAGGVRAQSPLEASTIRSPNLTLSHSLVGTPLYLSPEAIAGASPAVSFDLWSLNVLLLEATTGDHPFRGATVKETLERVSACEVAKALHLLSPSCQPLADYLGRALSREPGMRPRSALHVAESLRDIQHSL